MAGAPYIVWSPSGETPPKVSYQTHGAAHFAACRMAKQHPGQRFFVIARAGKGAFVDPDLATGCADDRLPVTAEEIRAATESAGGAVMGEELSIGQVQWHCSEEDGGPDVGILLRLTNDKYLWWGELLSDEIREGTGGTGFVLYGPDGAREVFYREDYNDVRILIEEHIAPAIARGAA